MVVPASWLRTPAPVALLFCYALGANTVILPLLASNAGLGATAIGVMVASSALGQIGVRLVVMRLAHRYGERTMIAFAIFMLAASGGIALLSHSAMAFLVAHVVQGAARGSFWIGLQSYVVRSQEDPKRSLASVDFLGGIGLTLGPLTIGALGGSLAWALAAGMVAAVAALWPVARLTPLGLAAPPHASPSTPVRQRLGAAPAVAAAMSTGAWRGLLTTYVPVFLNRAGYSVSTAGALVALGSICSIAGSFLVGKLRRRQIPVVYVSSALAVGSSLVVVGVLAHEAWLVGLALAASGVGAGALQTLSAVRAAYVTSDISERGRVVAQVGNYRAVALLAAPLTIGLLAIWIPLGAAIAGVGATTAMPAVVRWTRRPPVDA